MQLKRHILTLVAALAIFALALPAQGASRRTAKKKKAKTEAVAPDGLLDKARNAFEAYDFEGATEFLDDYETALSKSDKEPPQRYTDLRRVVDLGTTMLDRVEKIAIIDSLTVDSAAFFEAYRLSQPAGVITDSEALPASFPAKGNPAVFVTESGETMLWSAPKADGRELVESHLLADGSWEDPQPLGDAFRDLLDPAYPFLMPDGTTLYFAARGQESLGGYDIFVARNNGDEYLQPQNMGMPYNSPFDDYMLAIDEVTGAGWWATDRNRIDGKVTIYVFVPQEMRVNYPADTPDLTDRARITNIKATGSRDDYAGVLKAIDAAGGETAGESIEFEMAMPGGKIYRSLADFRNPLAREAMERYLDARDALRDDEASLSDLRAAFKAGSASRSEVLELENRVNRQRIELRRLANEVVKAETR